MDSECPTASRTAGQPTSAAGANFTFTAMQPINFGTQVPGLLGAFGKLYDAAAASSGLRPRHRLADGDGH